MSRRFAAILLSALSLGSAAMPSAVAAEWVVGDGFRSQPLGAAVGTGQAGFTRVLPAETGITFTNAIARERYLTNQIPLNGSGVTAGDVDGDGLPDVFFAGLSGASTLYRNLGGWRFGDVTATAFVPGAAAVLKGSDATGCVLADLDGDGDLDLVLNTIGRGTHLFFNDGKGRFEPGAVVNPDRCGASIALADLDGDGDLDLYVANYRVSTVRDDPNGSFRITQEGGRQRVSAYDGRSTSEPDLVGRFYVTPGGVRENGEPDLLLLNDGRGGFKPVVWSDGTFADEDGRPLVAPPYDWGLSVMARDFTGDGLPDLYVCNDFESPDRFWINETRPGGPLRFRAASFLALRTTGAFSMGIDGADVNRDGIWDFFVADMRSREHRLRQVQTLNLPPNLSRPGVYDDRSQFSFNTLQLGRGDGTFAEVARLAGVAASEWSWTPAFLDVDLDGFEDLLVSNGHELDMMDADVSARAEEMKGKRKLSRQELLELRAMFRRGNSPNAAFRNVTGDSKGPSRTPRFEDVSAAWGFADPEVSNGMCLADLDGDGDLDVLMNNLNGAAGLYRNNSGAPRIAVRLRGSRGNTRGVGAVVRVVPSSTGAFVTQSQEMVAGGRYLGGDDLERVFAAPGAVAGGHLTVTWRSGTWSVVSNLVAGTLYEVREDSARPAPAPAPKTPPIFEEQTRLLNHRHVDEPFNDRDRQPLLPRSLSTLGPGITWADLDGDGRDELLVGAGRSGMLAVFHNDSAPGKPGFHPMTNAVFARPLGRDLTTLVANAGVLVAGSSNYEDGTTNGGLVRLYLPEAGRTGESALGHDFAAGAVAFADIDGDGTLEQFIGGRARAGRYPESVPSILFRIKEGRYTVAQRFDSLGLVSGACFSDLDDDGDPDLVVALEWGPLRVFRNDGGKFVDATRALGLEAMTGWWNSVTAADFDEDGRMDLVAGNWGWNDFHSLGAPGPGRKLEPAQRSIHFADVEGRGAVDLIEGYREAPGGLERPVRQLASLGLALPSIGERFGSQMEFGQATLADVVKAAQGKAPGGAAPMGRMEAGWFASTIFLNRGDHFEAVPLPFEAQVSPVFGIATGDFNGDGHDDIVLVQNFFPVHPEEPRQDAGRGLLLLGDGRGGFRAVPGQESGFVVPGEGRGLAAGDFDGDGRLDVATAQNGAETRLFLNRGARPGLRVRLRGPGLNAPAFGARVRRVQEGRAGPWREVHGGAGYWSVDSPVMVLGRGEGEVRIEVVWPGGVRKSYAAPAAAAEIELAPDGTSSIRP